MDSLKNITREIIRKKIVSSDDILRKITEMDLSNDILYDLLTTNRSDQDTCFKIIEGSTAKVKIYNKNGLF